MYNYFKNIAKKNSCQSIGACSLHPSVSALYEVMLSQIREISFYLVKLNEFKITDKAAMAESIEALSVFIINTSFNKQKYLILIKRLYYLNNSVKQKYLEYCKNRELPCEIINSNLEINDDTTISSLIKYHESRQKNSDISKQRLFELITIFAKLCAVNIVKIKKLDESYDCYDYSILRFFALTNGYSIRNEKIKRRIKEFSHIAVKIKQKLFSLYEHKYGKKEYVEISTGVKKGHSILVSGDDLDELENLLNTLQLMKLSEPVNVYTNGALILAYLYPYFKNNKFLKGHFGSDNAQYDFSIFPGSILITQNFIQKIDSLYKGEIFSNKIISFERVFDLKNNDYKPVIEASLTLEGFQKDEEEKNIEIKYNPIQAIQDLKDCKNDKIAIITGSNENDDFSLEHENIKTIYLNCPFEIDELFETIENLIKNGTKVSIFFTQCELESLYSILSLLNLNIEIYLSNCSYALINPHAIEALSNEFGIKILQ